MYMAKYVKIPSWITDGPMDYEFKSYKMYSELEALSKHLANGKLFEVLLIVDETLEYLYKYDGDRLTSDYTTSDYELIGIDWRYWTRRGAHRFTLSSMVVWSAVSLSPFSANLSSAVRSTSGPEPSIRSNIS